MPPRQPKPSLALRVIASSCIVLWFLALSYCSIGLFDDGHHHAQADAHRHSDHSQESEAAAHAHGEPCHPHGPEESSRNSHPHDHSDDACCSSLVATAQFATPFCILKPVLQPIALRRPLIQACDLMPSGSKDGMERQGKPRDLVLTPVVCLGPAHRSLAPPSLA